MIEGPLTKILLSTLMTLLVLHACAQMTSRDSLERLLNLSLEYQVGKADSSVIYGQQALNLSERLHSADDEARSKSALGSTLWMVGDYLEADKFLLEALQYYSSRPYSIEFLSEHAAISSNKRDKGDYRDALYYSNRADSLDSANKPCRMCGAFKMITGSIYLDMNMPDSALYYIKQRPASGNDGYITWLFGRAYSEKGDDKQAYAYYQQSIANLRKPTNNPLHVKDLSEAYSSLAQFFKKEGNIDSCIFYAKQGYDIASNVNYTKGLWQIALVLSAAYEKKDAGDALRYYKLAMAARDKIFNIQKTSQFFNEQLRQREREAQKQDDQNKIRTYVLLGVLAFLVLIAGILYRYGRQKQKAKMEIEKAYADLKSTQAQLVQSEKMASLGELTAGIAHEIQNPLNFVNNFSEVNKELIGEMKNEIDSGNLSEAKNLAANIEDNEEKIIFHGKRADAIVKSMLQHSRASSGKKELTDINVLVEEYLRLAYHGLRAKDKSFNARFETDFDNSIGKINIVPQDIGRVILNLITNAFYSVSEKKKSQPENYEPTVSVATRSIRPALGDRSVEIKVIDNGGGIPQRVLDKIFQPFFTTKPTGQGTGLGLSLSYDIIKGHGGELKVDTKEKEFAEFTIVLPL